MTPLRINKTLGSWLTAGLLLACGNKGPAAPTTSQSASDHPAQRTGERAESATPKAPAPRPSAPLDDALWVKFAAGSFEMGSPGWRGDNTPQHTVALSAFALSRTETTVSQYSACVAAGACTAPGAEYDVERCNWAGGLWKQKQQGEHPVNCVTWEQAKAYCQSEGGQLPTEAQWEYAATDGGEDKTFPWGEAQLSCELAIVSDREPDTPEYEMDESKHGCGTTRTWPVCSRPKGNTKKGLCDMAGNAWEWVADTYERRWYEQPEASGQDVVNTAEGGDKVERGGSFYDDGAFSGTRARGYNWFENASPLTGFRCAKSI